MGFGYEGKLIRKETRTTEATKEIHVFEDSEAHIIWKHGGRLLKSGSVFNNFYGPDNCIESAIEEAERLCESFGVTPDSTLRIEVILKRFTVERELMREDYYGEPMYKDIPYSVSPFFETVVWDSVLGRHKATE